MSFEANIEVMRGEAKKWTTASTDMSTVSTRLSGNSTASGAFSIIGKPLGDEHDRMAVKLATWSSQGTTRFDEIGKILTWIADNYTGTDADQKKRYGG